MSISAGQLSDGWADSLDLLRRVDEKEDGLFPLRLLELLDGVAKLSPLSSPPAEHSPGSQPQHVQPPRDH